MLEGILYVVSPVPIPIPTKSIIAGLPSDKEGGYGDPDEVFKTISPEEATSILGRAIMKRDGLTVSSCLHFRGHLEQEAEITTDVLQ
jgi:hypothetical protein